MTRIVTSTYRYKRPPPKRKAQAAEIIPQAIVKARKPKPRHVMQLEEAKSSIVTVRKRGRRFADVPDMTSEEHQRRGDLAGALWREMARRVTDKGQS